MVSVVNPGIARRWILAGAMLAGVTGAVHANDEDTLARIRASGAVVIGYRGSSIPLSYLAGDRPVGYSVDVCRFLAADLAKALGLKSVTVNYREVTPVDRFDAIRTGRVDLECGSTTNTAARRRLVAFTIPHFLAASRLMVRASDPFAKIEDLNGRRVASTAGTTNVASLKREASLKGLTIDVPEAADHAEAVRWLLAGKVDGFAMDDVLLYGLRAESAKPSMLKVIGKPMTVEPYAIAFAKGEPQLKRLVDSTLRRLIESGELRRLYDRWFMQPIPPKGIDLEMPISPLLEDSWRFPSDFVPDE